MKTSDYEKELEKQFQHCNFKNKEGDLYLVRCFLCEPEFGRENYAPNVAKGVCAWCGWAQLREKANES